MRQVADVVAIDLVQRAVAPAVESAPPHEPVIGRRGLQHRVGDGNELGRGLRDGGRDVGGGHRGRQDEPAEAVLSADGLHRGRRTRDTRFHLHRLTPGVHGEGCRPPRRADARRPAYRKSSGGSNDGDGAAVVRPVVCRGFTHARAGGGRRRRRPVPWSNSPFTGVDGFTRFMTRTMLRSGGPLLLGLALAAAPAAAAAPTAQPSAGETAVDETAVGEAPADATAVDALRCWRRVDRNAVFVGERFTMTVTCRTVETEAARTRIDEAALEPATIDAAPFEVLSGERFDDVPTGPYRFSQHDYTLRLIAETGFGEDVEIPALDLSYRIERRAGDGPALAGRELTYILPPESVRLLSLVPDDVDDIRDLPPADFEAAQAGELRANLMGLLSALFGVAALGLVALGALRVVRDRGGIATVAEKRLSPALAARRALEELVRVRGAVAANGWTRDGAGRALAALRVASAVALSRPVTQSPMAAGDAPRDGQLRVHHGLLGRRTAALSSSVTTTDWHEAHRDDGAEPLAGRAEHSGHAEHRSGDVGRPAGVGVRPRRGANSGRPASGHGPAHRLPLRPRRRDRCRRRIRSADAGPRRRPRPGRAPPLARARSGTALQRLGRRRPPHLAVGVETPRHTTLGGRRRAADAPSRHAVRKTQALLAQATKEQGGCIAVRMQREPSTRAAGSSR